MSENNLSTQLDEGFLYLCLVQTSKELSFFPMSNLSTLPFPTKCPDGYSKRRGDKTSIQICPASQTKTIPNQ